MDASSAARAFRFYRFEAREVKLLCEREYGAAVFVRAVVERAIPPAS